MNVACPACPAKYAVPDEKVRGKKARITCKRCGAAIIIDGTVLDQPSKLAPRPKPEPLPPPPEPLGSSEEAAVAEPWLVAITDEHQEPASTDRIVSLYAAGTIDAETFLWKEGMDEWQTAFEIPEIATALDARGLSHRVVEPGVESVPIATKPYEDDEATHIGRPSALAGRVAPASAWTEPGRWGGEPSDEPQGYDDDLTIARESAPLASPYPLKADEPDDAQTVAREPSGFPPGSSPRATSDGDSERSSRASAPRVEEQQPASSRRQDRASRPTAEPEAAVGGASGARRAIAGPGSERGRGRVADLFGAQAVAGAEDDPSLGRDSSPPDAGAKLTGQRNESSVLFSLNELIKAESAPESRRAPRATSKNEREAELLLGGAAPSSIAGLGGDFNSLVAPDLMAPARAMPDPLSSGRFDEFDAPPSKGPRALKLLALIVLAAGVGAAIAIFVPKMLNPPQAPIVAAPAASELAVPPKPAESPPAGPSEEPSASASAAGPAPKAKDVGALKPESNGASEPSRGTADARPSAKADESAAEKSATEPAKEKDLAAAMSESQAPPFDTGAAKSALVTAASSAASCKQQGGPTGTGRALVTFAPSGRVTKAEITGDFAGTGVGGCVARLFRAARVPKFAGDATTVSKNFTIE